MTSSSLRVPLRALMEVEPDQRAGDYQLKRRRAMFVGVTSGLIALLLLVIILLVTSIADLKSPWRLPWFPLVLITPLVLGVTVGVTFYAFISWNMRRVDPVGK
jgi:ABC-type antimicrobial peptide transport system permease subunit